MMFNEAQWSELMGMQNSLARALAVENQVIEYFAGYTQSDPLRTAELAEKLWPSKTCQDQKGRQKMYDALLYLANSSLTEYVTRGPKTTRVMYGRQTVTRPWLWHAPEKRASKVCPKCGAEL